MTVFHARRLWLATALALALPACSSHAHRQPNRIHGALSEASVIDRDTGERLPVYWHNGQRYVVGVPGHRYAIEIANRSAGRVLMVVSVDGVNAVTGQTAAWDQAGYVMTPGNRWEVRGWRKSSEQVAAFEFTAHANAYATRTGRGQEVGVIGVAVFREKEVAPPVVLAPAVPQAKSAAAAESAADAPEQGALARSAAPRQDNRLEGRLGTGHGRSETSVVGHTQFERAQTRPDEVITVYYNSYENLLAAGVIPAAVAQPQQPNPFPLQGGFVPDPPR